MLNFTRIPKIEVGLHRLLQLLSYTFRYKLLNLNNKNWKQEMYYDSSDHSHCHLTPTDESAWAGLLPKRSLK
ncbi:hypothetical protein Hanom_Chr09g00781461 [Helianthus anomalus]